MTKESKQRVRLPLSKEYGNRLRLFKNCSGEM